MPLKGVKMPEIDRYENTDWTLVSCVKASKRRTQILKKVQQQPRMNGDLADELDLSTAYVRRNMNWLEEHELVEDLTESKANYKLYGITELGEEITEYL